MKTTTQSTHLHQLVKFCCILDQTILTYCRFSPFAVVANYYLHLLDQAATPAVVTQYDVGDDDDDEPLNENDDDDLDDVDQGEELNTQHLVLAQFDKVCIIVTL